MKKAKIINGKINIINGMAPSDYLDVTQMWSIPTDYPIDFYLKGSNGPLVSFIDGKFEESWKFTLKNTEMIKDVIYDLLKKERSKRQKGPFTFDGATITLKNRSDAVDIALLSDTAKSYKLGRGQWVTTPGKIIQLKNAVASHVQNSFDWEKEQNNLVETMTTIDELKTYFDLM